jgi:tetratricopeptide (TPR) repeat protein
MVVGALAAAALQVAAPSAHASDPTARAEAGREFRRGEAAFKAGAYADAADAFEHAYAIAPNTDTLFNAAQARERAGQLARAARLYVRVLADTQTAPKNRQDASQRMNELSTRLARLVVVAQAAQSIQIDGEAAAADETYADPGEHVVVVTFASGTVTRKVSAAAGVRTQVVIEPPAAATAPLAPPPPAAEVHEKPLSPVWFFAAAGVTVGLGAATTVSGLDANSARTKFDMAPSQAGLDAGYGKVTRTNVLLVSTLVAGVATAAIGVFAVRWRKSSAAATATNVLRLGGSFE